MGDGCHDSDLATLCENTRSQTYEDLCECDDTGVRAGRAEGDEESGAQQGDRNTRQCDPLEVTRPAD